MEYIIVGDTASYKGCLVAVCGGDRKRAEQMMNRMVSNPSDNDKWITKGHFNLRIEQTDNGWWNDPFLAN